MRRLLLTGGMLLWSLVTVLAQGFPLQHRRVPAYDFASFKENRISGESEDFELFLRKLDTLVTTGKGDVRILHVGGSHVQGGSWTGRLRENLLGLRYGLDGGRGLVFPFAVAGTNTPSTYRSYGTGTWEASKCLHPDCVLGATGMAITTSDSTATATVDMMIDGRIRWTPAFCFNRVTVLGYGSLEPVIIMGRDTLRGREQAGRWAFELPHYTDYARVGFRGYPGRYTLKGMYLDRTDGGLTVSEAGVNGATTSSWLRCDDFVEDLELVMPDLVILSIGINDIQGADFSDTRFIQNYKEIIRRIRKVNPHCAILLTTINDSWKHGNPNRYTESAVAAARKVARETGAVLWDLYEIMGGHGSMEGWAASGLAASDRVHFNASGYGLLGNLMFNALMDRIER